MNFNFFAPTRIVFGSGKLTETGKFARALSSTAVVVCGSSALSLGYVERVRASLATAGVSCHVVSGIASDPKSLDVDRIVDIARQTGAGVLVGIGGGSVLDATKAAGVAVSYSSAGPLVGRTLEPNAHDLPVIAVPTTAGTGAEVTKGAIIFDEARRLKSGVRGEGLFPKVAIVDPDLLRTMPRDVMAETVFDAITHAVESYVCRQATPISMALSEKALALLGDCIAKGLDLTDPDIRARLALGALIGGLNVGTVSSCLPHRIQQAMGSIRSPSCSHARGLALVYRGWLNSAYPFASDRFNRIGEIFGARDACTAIEAILEKLGITSRLSEAGFTAKHFPEILTNITGNIENDPIDAIDSGKIEKILEAAL